MPDSISVYINGAVCCTAGFNGDENASALIIKKALLKSAKHFSIVIKGSSIQNVRYKKSIEAELSPSIQFEEIKDKPGNFNFSNPSLVKQLSAGKMIPLYLVMEPANPMMMIPSKRLFIGKLQAK